MDIKKELKKRKISQSRFAKMLDSTSNTVNNWCTGKYKPNKHYAGKIKKLFNQ